MSNSLKKESHNKNTPIYKQWWFWVIIGVVVLAGFGTTATKTGQDPSTTDTLTPPASDPTELECAEEEKVTIIDFSTMGANDIAKWAQDNDLEYKVGDAQYSDTVARESVLSQSISAGESVCKGTTIVVSYSLGKEPTVEQKNALAKAQSYSELMNMSKASIYRQLTSEYGEGFSAEDAQYAIDNLNADYKANALAKAKSYQENMHMSKSKIYEQLTSEYGEGFTAEEAQYAIDNLPN